MDLAQRLVTILSRKGQCFNKALEIVFAVMAVVDGVICVVAAVQFFRIHFLIRKWTRQKVFHAMVAVSNFGYCLYFLINPRAVCGSWPCWNHVCGFMLLAVPQIVFLATFLLLLSFWIDLCHQTSDLSEEEEDEAEAEAEGQPGAPESSSGCSKPFSRRRWRLWWKKLRPRGRKAVFVGVVTLICLLTAIFALLIWVGMGHNPIDSVAVAELYADLFATLTLLCGGGLAIYGLLLYSKMRRVRSGQTSADLGKVATLAIVCLICFTFRALLVLVNNLRIVTSQQRAAKRASPLYPLVTLCYYLIGESVPSIFVLICLREMPVGGVKGTRRGSLSSLTSLDEISQPLLSPAPNGLLPGPAPQPAVAPWIASPPVPPEPGEKPGRGTSSTLEHPRRAKAHALGSKRPIGRR